MICSGVCRFLDISSLLPSILTLTVDQFEGGRSTVDRPPDALVGPLYAKLPSLSPDAGNRVVIRDVFAGLVARAALAKLCGHIECWKPDAIVRETQEYASAAAGPLLGVPVVRIAIVLGQVEHCALELALEPVQELRDSVGLPPDPTGRDLHGAPCYTLFPHG